MTDGHVVTHFFILLRSSFFYLFGKIHVYVPRQKNSPRMQPVDYVGCSLNFSRCLHYMQI